LGCLRASNSRCPWIDCIRSRFRLIMATPLPKKGPGWGNSRRGNADHKSHRLPSLNLFSNYQTHLPFPAPKFLSD
jgi:hypothetical protein